ncbi:MAG: glycosyltransferase family 4 protein [Chloroflexota bacterium]
MIRTIGYDATAAVRQAAGIGRYTRELLRSLSAGDDEFRYHAFSCSGGAIAGGLPPLNGKVRHRAVPVSDRVMNAIWHRAHLPVPAQLFTGRFDLFHSPDFTLPPVLNRPTILTVHDLGFLRSPGTAYPTLRAYLQRTVPASISRATRVIAVSENTRRDLMELLNVPPERVSVIYEGVGSDFHPPYDLSLAEKTLHRYGIQGPYILSVGTLEPRKNYQRLLEAYALLRRRGVEHRLVIAGRPGWMFQPVLQRLDDLGLRAYTSIIEPNDEALVDLYGMADAFVYPSLYEGFGIPPLEALACGAPAAVAGTSSLPEVVGDAALTFDPLDVDSMAGALEALLVDKGLAARLRAAGPQRAANFSWESAALQTTALYRQVLDG